MAVNLYYAGVLKCKHVTGSVDVQPVFKCFAGSGPNRASIMPFQCPFCSCGRTVLEAGILPAVILLQVIGLENSVD